MNILGINSFFEHPSISIVSNGKLLFSIEDERLTKIKGGKRYTPYSAYVPFMSIYEGLRYLDWTIEDIDKIGFSYSMNDHLIGSIGCLTNRRLSSIAEEVSAYCALRNFKKLLRSEYQYFQYMYDRMSPHSFEKIPLIYLNHHLCHAASAYYCSNFEESLIMVADGSGENASTSVYLGKNGKMKKLKQFLIPNSLGFLYSFVTKHLGFNPFADEYKVMGLASYGQPKYINELSMIVNIYEGGYKISKSSLLRISDVLGKKRAESDEITDRHKDIAKSLQVTLERVLVSILKYFQRLTKVENLCMAGGTSLNCVANGVVFESGIFKNIFIQPAASDAGTSIGAAALINAHNNLNEYKIEWDNMFLGTSYSNNKIKSILDECGVAYKYLEDFELINIVAKKMTDGMIGGVFRGRMEAGPRALGNRSVIASPSREDTLRKINILKGREMFRPIAPIIIDRAFESYFMGEKNEYMLFTCRAKPEVIAKIPAVVHVDGTSRVQVVTEKSNKFIYDLILNFEKLSGVPVIINTSLNFKGQPIVENPLDAVGSFYTSQLDFLILENFLLEK